MNESRIRTQFRLEQTNPKVCGDSGNRVWVDVWVDNVPCQGTCIYSGCLELAQAIIDGTVRLKEDGVTIEVATGEPHPLCHVTQFRKREERRKSAHKS